MIYSVAVDTYHHLPRYHVEYMSQRKEVFNHDTVPAAVLDFLESGNHKAEFLNDCCTVYYRKHL